MIYRFSIAYFLMLATFSLSGAEITIKDLDSTKNGVQIFQYNGEERQNSTRFEVGEEDEQAGLYFLGEVSYSDDEFLVFEFNGVSIGNESTAGVVLAIPSATTSTADAGGTDVYIEAHSINGNLLVFQSASGLTISANTTYEIRGLNLQSPHLAAWVNSYGLRNLSSNPLVFDQSVGTVFDAGNGRVFAVANAAVRNTFNTAKINHYLTETPKISRQGVGYLGEARLFFRVIPTLKVTDNDFFLLTITGAELSGANYSSSGYEFNDRGIDLTLGVPTDNGIPQAEDAIVYSVSEQQLLIAPPPGYEFESLSRFAMQFNLKNITDTVTVKTALIRSGVHFDQSATTDIAVVADQITASVSQSFSRLTDFREEVPTFMEEKDIVDRFKDTIHFSIKPQTSFANINQETRGSWEEFAPFYKLQLTGTDFSFLTDENGELDVSKISLSGTVYANNPTAYLFSHFVRFRTEAIELDENKLTLYVAASDNEISIELDIDGFPGEYHEVHNDFSLSAAVVGYQVDDSDNLTDELVFPVIENIDVGQWQSNALDIIVPYFRYVPGDEQFIYINNRAPLETPVKLTVLDSVQNQYIELELEHEIKANRVQSIASDVFNTLTASGIDMSQPLYFRFTMDLSASATDLTIGTNRRGQRMLYKVRTIDNGF